MPRTTMTIRFAVSAAFALTAFAMSPQQAISQNTGSQAAARFGQLNTANKTHTPPVRPALSPYLDLLRVDSGVVSPYHSFVVPRRQVAQQQTLQSFQIKNLQGRQRAVESRIRNGSMDSRGPSTTGGGGHFQNYLHFYPSFGQRR